jgi:histidinol phosphatase-like PHP family hydrolase
MINLHVHSTWSDGRYTPEALAKAAAVSGLTHLGICDHFYTEKLHEFQAYVDVQQIGSYIAAIRDTGERFAKWMHVLVGIEVDWSLRARRKLDALWNQIDEFDYVLFEYVQDEEWLGSSLGALLAVRSRIDIPVGLAHNHLARNLCPRYTPRELARLLQEHDIFVELSTAPHTAYYRDTTPLNLQVWDALADSDVWFSVGSDAHTSIDDVSGVGDAYRFLRDRGLLDRLITACWDSVRRRWKEQQ